MSLGKDVGEHKDHSWLALGSAFKPEIRALPLIENAGSSSRRANGTRETMPITGKRGMKNPPPRR